MRTFVALGALITVFSSAAGAEKVANWVKVVDHAEWQPRDSQGELVYRDKMWILGGWFNSFVPAPRDVTGQALGGRRSRQAAEQRSLVPVPSPRLVRG